MKLDGQLWIAEPSTRFPDIGVFKDLLFRLGFDVSRVEEKWKFIFIKALKSEREINEEFVSVIKPQAILM